MGVLGQGVQQVPRTTMQRRKFLLGMGSLAAGGAAATGTGAYDSVQAKRNVAVQVADDNNAPLRLTTEGADNSAYASNHGDAISIDLNSNGKGNGVNADALTQINDIFRVQNQGTEPAVVYVDPSSIPGDCKTTTEGFGIDPQATGRPNGDFTATGSLEGGVENDQISLTGIYSSPPYECSNYIEEGDNEDDAIEEFVLGTGQYFEFGLFIDTRNGDYKGSFDMEIVADTTEVPTEYMDI